MNLATAVEEIETWPVETRLDLVQRVWASIVGSGWRPTFVREHEAELEEIANYRAPDEVRSRVAELVRREKTGGLTHDEKVELDHYLRIEHLMRLTKARAGYAVT